MYYFNKELPNIYITLNKKNFELLEKMIHPNTKKFIINLIKTAFKYKIINKKKYIMIVKMKMKMKMMMMMIIQME